MNNFKYGYGNFDSLVFQSGGISESKVNELIEKSNAQLLSQVEQKIEDSFVEAKSSGRFDDTKVYNNYAEMVASEPIGRKDVLYIIITDEEDKGTRYIWDGVQYVSIQDTLTKSDLESIVQ